MSAPRAILEVAGIRCGYGAEPVLDGVSFRVAPGDVVAVIGPNGSGKTTLLRVIARAVAPQAGGVYLDGRDVHRMAPGAVARSLAVVQQDLPAEVGFPVEEMVALGRLPHAVGLSGEGPADWAAVARALEQTGTARLAQRPFDRLSGGERQKVTLARALAQEPRVLLLDEPTAHLDIHHQLEVMDLLLGLAEKQELTVLAVFHDLNLAAAYADYCILMGGGTIQAIGPPAEVLTPENIERVYGCPVAVQRHPVTGTPVILLLPRTRLRGYPGVHRRRRAATPGPATTPRPGRR